MSVPRIDLSTITDAAQLKQHVAQALRTAGQHDLAAQWDDDTWVRPIHTAYRGHTVHQLPPNAQGIATLIAGIAQRHRDDEARLAQGSETFEALYEHFSRKR